MTATLDDVTKKIKREPAAAELATAKMVRRALISAIADALLIVATGGAAVVVAMPAPAWPLPGTATVSATLSFRAIARR